MLSFFRKLLGAVSSKANKSGTQTIAQGTNVILAGWTVDPAYPGTDITTNPNKITIRSAGVKNITAAVVYDGGNGGYGLSANLYKNTSTQLGATQSSTLPAATLSFNIPAQSLAVNDTLEIQVAATLFAATVQPTGTFIAVDG